VSNFHNFIENARRLSLRLGHAAPRALPPKVVESRQPDRASVALRAENLALRKRADAAERALGEYRRALVIIAKFRSSPDTMSSPFEHLARGEKRRGILEKT
jgi:hypothetical protein